MSARALRSLVVAALVAVLATSACKKSAPPMPAPQDDRVHIQVDRRIELFSILFRLVGGSDYAQAARGPYADAVDAHFGPFREHAAVALSREVRRKYGVSYNAPLTLAVQLDDALRPARPLSPLPAGVDARWKDADLDAYLAAVRDFADATGLDAFLRSQASYTARVEQRFAEFLADKPVVAWFDATFGRRDKASYLIAPGLLTGNWNYGLHAVRPDGTELIVQVMNLEAPDAAGLPRPGETTHALLAHELAHTYVNPVMDPRIDSLMPVVGSAFDSVHEQMARETYDKPSIFVDESVVRAVVVLYLRDRAGDAAARRSLAEQKSLSFNWTEPLSAAFDGVRKENGGKISEEALVSATQKVFASGGAR